MVLKHALTVEIINVCGIFGPEGQLCGVVISLDMEKTITNVLVST